MACSSFFDCVNDPLVTNDIPIADQVHTIGGLSVYAINMALYLFYAALIVFVVWCIFKGIYAIIGADSSESYEKFRGAITNAVFAAIGIALLGGSRFFLIIILKALGIPDAQNIFMDDPLKLIFGI